MSCLNISKIIINTETVLIGLIETIFNMKLVSREINRTRVFNLTKSISLRKKIFYSFQVRASSHAYLLTGNTCPSEFKTKVHFTVYRTYLIIK